MSAARVPTDLEGDADASPSEPSMRRGRLHGRLEHWDARRGRILVEGLGFFHFTPRDWRGGGRPMVGQTVTFDAGPHVTA